MAGDDLSRRSAPATSLRKGSQPEGRNPRAGSAEQREIKPGPVGMCQKADCYLNFFQITYASKTIRDNALTAAPISANVLAF